MLKEENLIIAELKPSPGKKGDSQSKDDFDSEFEMLEGSLKKWKIYRTSCQLRLGYFSFLIMLSVLLFSFTILMEIFFAVFLPSARNDPHFFPRSILFLCALPLTIIILSWIFEESSRFFFDSLRMNSGGLFHFRLSLVTIIHYYRHLKYHHNIPLSPSLHSHNEILQTVYTPIDRSTLVLVDLIVPVAFEIITLLAFIIESFSKLSFGKGFGEYIRVGFYTTLGYLFMWIILHFWTNKNGKMATFILHYALKKKAKEEEAIAIAKQLSVREMRLEILGFRFGRTLAYWSQRLLPQCTLVCCNQEEMEENVALPQAENIQEKHVVPKSKTKKIFSFIIHWRKLRFTYRILILIPLMVASAILSFFYFYTGWLTMGFLLIVTADAMRSRYNRVFGKTFRTFVSIFVVLSLLFFSSTWWIGTFVIGGEFTVYPPSQNRSVHAAQPNVNWANLPTYPICDFNYSSLDIIDLVLIADAAYGSNTSIQQNSLEQRFSGTELSDYVYVTRNDEAKDAVTWMELRFPKANVTVIAVRGTASATDALEDMHFWFGIGLFQTVNTVFPFLSQLPQNFVVKMLEVLSLEPIMPEPIYMNLVRHADAVLDRVGPENLIIVGHSLGGAIAGMVGAKLSVPAVSFSGPGLIYTRGRFHLDEADIRHFVITIKPMRDLVPKVDMLGGLVQQIDCQKTNPLACHSTTTHACELYYACGDSRKRDWSQAKECQNFIRNPPPVDIDGF